MATDNYISTCSGKRFTFTAPALDAINIEDIAHALSHLCRFVGHTNEFYSVAQHSVFVSKIVPPEHALTALLHDATEAFLGDISKPLKQLLPEYVRLEEIVWQNIASVFELPFELPECVKRADLIALATEKKYLLPAAEDQEWPCLNGIEPHPTLKLKILSPPFAKWDFLDRYAELTGGSVNAA